MIGDISYITDKDNVDVKIDDEEKIRLAQDKIDTDKIAALEISVPAISLKSTTDRIDLVTKNINDQLGESISSSEYLNTPLYLNYFPNLPSNNIKSIYYTDFINLTNAVGLKLKTLVDSTKLIITGLNTNQAYKDLLYLNSSEIPALTSKIDTLFSINGSANQDFDTFTEIVDKINTVKKGSVGQAMLDQYAQVDNLMSDIQTKDTRTRYYDATTKKYYKLFIDNQKINLQESYSPSTVLYNNISTADVYSPASTPNENTINLYNADFHTTIKDTVYVIKGDYLYLYNKLNRILIAKIRYQLARFNANSNSAEYKEEYRVFREMYKPTLSATISDSASTLDYFATYSAVFRSYFKYKLGDVEYWKNKESIYLFESSDSKLLFLGGSHESVSICIINLEKLNDMILANTALKGPDVPYINSYFFADKNNYLQINIYDNAEVADKISALVDPLDKLNPVPKTKMSSLYYDPTIKTLFVAFANNLIVLYDLNTKKTIVPADNPADVIIKYGSSYKYSASFRLGGTETEQNMLKIRAIIYEHKTSSGVSSNTIYCAVSTNITSNFDEPIYEDSVCSCSIKDPIKFLSKVFTASKGSFILSNNLCSLNISEQTDGVLKFKDYVVSSKNSGSKYFQYYWKNTKYEHDKLIRYNNQSYDSSTCTGIPYDADYDLSYQYINKNSAPNDFYELNLNENEIIFESYKYLIIMNKFKEKVNIYRSHQMYTYSIKMYDKINDVYVYDTTLYDLDQAESVYTKTQTRIDNLTAITQRRNTSNDANTNGTINYNDLVFVGVESIKSSPLELKLIFEGSFNDIDKVEMLTAGLNHLDKINNKVRLSSHKTSYQNQDSYIITHNYPKLDLNRRLYYINCKLSPL